MKNIAFQSKGLINRKRKGIVGGLWELALVLGLMMIILATVLYGYPAYRNFTNRTVCYDEMEKIQAACISYAAASVTNKAPDDLTTLFNNPSITADEAIDGADHENFLVPKKFKSTNSNTSGDIQINDPWGKPYEYSMDADGVVTITSVGSGTDIIKSW